MPSDLSRYQYDPSLIADFVKAGTPALLDFTKQQQRWGGKPERSVDEIYERAGRLGELNVYGVPEDLYSQIRGNTGGLSSGAFHRGNQIFMKNFNPRAIGHELGHDLYGHSEEHGQSVPSMNWYNKLDRKLKGWLPSLSKYAERPKFTSIENTLRRKRGFVNFEDREEYNKRMLTGKYNPKFADAPFDVLNSLMWKAQSQEIKNAMLSNPIDIEETKGGGYDIYDKRSLKAKDFRYAFKEARQEGLKEFDWDGMKYTTELA
jgi:hypothetical protein